MRYSYRNNVGENRVLPSVCNAHDCTQCVQISIHKIYHTKTYVTKQNISSRRAADDRPYGNKIKGCDSMGSHRIERTTEDIKRELTAIFRELKDPRVQQAFISIVRVEVTNDLSYCTVQVSAIEGLDRAKEAVKGLKSASGFIRRELGHRLHLRHVPELIFHATDSIEYSANISRILNSLDIKEDEEENDESI